jgi:hypothetical protein
LAGTGEDALKPQDLHPADRRRQRRQRDFAFAGFLYLGWMLAMAFLWNRIPVTTPGYWAVGSFLSTPALVLAVPASMVAIVYTIVARRERLLWVMTALSMAVAPVLWCAERLPDSWSPVVGSYFVVLTMLLLGSPLSWFLHLRWAWSRLVPGEPVEESKRDW